MKLAVSLLVLWIGVCHGQTVIYAPASSNPVSVIVPGPTNYVANANIVFTNYTNDVSRILPQVWEVPAMARVVVAWEPSPDTRNTRFEYRSAKTTNTWTKIIPESVDYAQGSATLILDLSVPTQVQTTAIGDGGVEAYPNSPIKIPAIVRPRPHGSLRFMYSQPLTDEHLSRLRRGLAAPQPSFPPLPP